MNKTGIHAAVSRKASFVREWVEVGRTLLEFIQGACERCH